MIEISGVMHGGIGWDEIDAQVGVDPMGVIRAAENGNTSKAVVASPTGEIAVVDADDVAGLSEAVTVVPQGVMAS